MAFGQQSGPPATTKQVQQLLALLQDAGHTDFRDARGPLGFTQRQAAGKFTRDEADTLIEQLQATDGADGDGGSDRADGGSPPPRLSVAERALRAVPDHELAAELQRRGWVVMEP